MSDQHKSLKQIMAFRLEKLDTLRKAGVDVQYQVAQAKKRVVKITMLTPVEPDKWDAICDGGTSG